jgi:hypothetical protein
MRIASGSVVALFFAVQAAWASPEEDAAFIAEQVINAEDIERALTAWKEELTAAFSGPLAVTGISIADPERFASMIPDSATDERMARLYQDIADEYLSRFTSEQLEELAAFHRTNILVKLRAAFEVRAIRYSRSDDNIAELNREDLLQVLTPEELIAYEEFSNTETGRALERHAFPLGLTQASAYTFHEWDGSVLVPLEPDMRGPYLLDIFEADGVIRFPNPIWRKDAIEQLRNEIE